MILRKETIDALYADKHFEPIQCEIHEKLHDLRKYFVGLNSVLTVEKFKVMAQNVLYDTMKKNNNIQSVTVQQDIIDPTILKISVRLPIQKILITKVKVF